MMTDAERYRFIVDNKVEIVPDGQVWTDVDTGESFVSPFIVNLANTGIHGYRSLDQALQQAKAILEFDADG